VISIIYEQDVIRKILAHLNLWEQDLPPPAEEWSWSRGKAKERGGL